MQDVRNYYRHVLRPYLTTIVVMGEITPDHAREVVQKYFGEWKASGPKPPTTLPPVPLNTTNFAVVPNSSRVQDLVLIGEVLGLTRSNFEIGKSRGGYVVHYACDPENVFAVRGIVERDLNKCKLRRLRLANYGKPKPCCFVKSLFQNQVSLALHPP